eukprot:3271048-Rhodomonas_salina.2
MQRARMCRVEVQREPTLSSSTSHDPPHRHPGHVSRKRVAEAGRWWFSKVAVSEYVPKMLRFISPRAQTQA